MARTTDSPSAGTPRIARPDPAREANGNGPRGDEQGRKDPTSPPPADNATDTPRRSGPAPDRGEDDRMGERRDLRVAGEDSRGSGRPNTDGLRACTDPAAAHTEQARATAVDNTHELQDALLGVVRQGQEATMTLMGMWTDTVRRPGLFGGAPARAAISGGYDLFAQFLAEQRRFVDALIDQHRHFAEALLTPPEHR